MPLHSHLPDTDISERASASAQQQAPLCSISIPHVRRRDTLAVQNPWPHGVGVALKMAFRMPEPVGPRGSGGNGPAGSRGGGSDASVQGTNDDAQVRCGASRKRASAAYALAPTPFLDIQRRYVHVQPWVDWQGDETAA